MKISLNWLKKYISFNLSPEELSHKLTMAGLEVEKMFSIKGDTVFELEITPNRPDCLSVIGIAREISAILNKSLQYPKINKSVFPKKKCGIQILDKKGCPRYIGTLIRDVNVNSSCPEIKRNISAVGIRAVNSVVDITNFCLIETGQPLHAFDYDKLQGDKIIVRRARKGEKIITIDGKERILNPSVLVIADARRPVAIAGIMGGKETEVTEGTRNILLESAYFDPFLIRASSRALGISTDSSYRFERGVNKEMVAFGARRATELLLTHSKGKVATYSDDNDFKKGATPQHIKISKSRIDTVVGENIPLSKCKIILRKLGCDVSLQKKDVLKIIPPSFRGDLKKDVDIIEEITRIIGYDNIPFSLPYIKMVNIAADTTRSFKRSLSFLLRGQGFNEAITYAMTSQRNLEKSQVSCSKILKIKNPLTEEQEFMRPSLLPSLMAVVLLNINRGQKNIRLFELGKIYSLSGERDALGLIMIGSKYYDWRNKDIAENDFYDIKGVVEQISKKNGINPFVFESFQQSIFEKGKGCCFKMGSQKVGILGEINQDILQKWNIKKRGVFFAQIDIQKIFEHRKIVQEYQPISEFPSIVRDVSLAIKKQITFKQVKDIACRLGGELLVSIKFIEEYFGNKIPFECRGITFSLVYQSSSHTLKEEEVEQIHGKICQAFIEQLDAKKR